MVEDLWPRRTKGACLQSQVGARALALVVNVPLRSAETLWDWERWACSWGEVWADGPLVPSDDGGPICPLPFPFKLSRGSSRRASPDLSSSMPSAATE